MDSTVSWNIRGLNWPNKQEDVRLFLQSNKVGLIRLLETKVKVVNVDKVASHTFPGWNCHYNFSYNPKGRIWIAWRPSSYNLEVLQESNQYIHCLLTLLSSNKKLFITIICGMNRAQ